MLASLIRFSLRFRGVVLALAAMLLLFGGYTLSKAQYDIFPEFLPPQVMIQTEAPGLAPEQVEALVTHPVESVIQSVPDIDTMRSSSMQGLSVIHVNFKPGSDIFRQRQMVSERLETISNSFPTGVHLPVMTPMTTSTGVVYAFGLTSDTVSQMALRTQADWVIKQRLLAVPGVNKVSVFGGEVREMQVQVLLDKLRFFNLSLLDVVVVAERATSVQGAGFIDTPGKRVMLQTFGQALTPERLANTVFIRGADEAGEAIDLNIVLGDIAHITEAAKPPISMASVMGKKGVLVYVSSQYGANTPEVTRGIEDALAELKPVLEKQGVVFSGPTFRPANFIENAIGNLHSSMWLGAFFVIAVLFFFLRHTQSALISAAAIPMSLLTAATVLHYLGYSLNTMTLGGLAIAIGSVVDDAVIDVENIVRRLRQNRLSNQPLPALKVMYDSVLEVRLPVVFASLAVVLVFIPVITMSGLGGRFFSPLGVAHSIAIIASLLVAVTLTPALCALFLNDKAMPLQEPDFVQKMKSIYQQKLERFSRTPKVLMVPVALFTLASLCSLPFMRGEFLPELREGHFILHMTTAAGTSLEESIRMGNEVTETLQKLPAIRSITQHAGRAEQGDETLGTHISEFDVALHPLSGADMEKADKDIDKALEGIAGAHFAVDTFLTERVEETISGYIAGTVLNIYGHDLDALDKAAHDIMALLETVPEATHVQLQSPEGAPQLSIRLRDKDLHYWGFIGSNVISAIHAAYQGVVAGHLYEDNRVTDLSVILDPQLRKDVAQVNELVLRSPAGSYVRIDQLADVEQLSGRYAVLHDGGRRVQTITMDAKNHDNARLIATLKKAIAEKVTLPEGSYVSFTGTAQVQEESQHDLVIYGLLTVAAILLLVFAVLHHGNNLLLVMANIPFALAGGIGAVWLTGGELSLGALVGLVTLFGLSLRNSVMLLSHYEHLVSHEGQSWNLGTVLRGSTERLLPVVMTALVTALGLLPLALGSGEAGREIEGPMAVVILGGLVTSTLLNLLVLPALALRYGKFGDSEA